MSVDRKARSASSGFSSIPLALLVFAIWVAFAPALGAGFVNYDDTELLVNNARFRGFGAAELSWMFTTTHLGPYQPLSWLSYAVDHAVGGMDPAVFHRTNLLLHAAGAIALYFLARRVILDLAGTAQAELGAFAAALLFAVHPLRVESVAWCTERRDVLAAPFFFLALLCWWRYARGAGRRDYALALVVSSFRSSRRHRRSSFRRCSFSSTSVRFVKPRARAECEGSCSKSCPSWRS